MKRIAKFGAAALVLALGLGAAPIARAADPTPPTEAQKEQMREKMREQHQQNVEAQKKKVQEQHQSNVETNKAKMHEMNQESVDANKAKLQAEQQQENAKKLEEMKSAQPPAEQ